MTDWDYNYMKRTKLPPEPPEPEPIHWGYKLLGMGLAMLMLSWVGAWIAEGLAL